MASTEERTTVEGWWIGYGGFAAALVVALAQLPPEGARRLFTFLMSAAAAVLFPVALRLSNHRERVVTLAAAVVLAVGACGVALTPSDSPGAAAGDSSGSPQGSVDTPPGSQGPPVVTSQPTEPAGFQSACDSLSSFIRCSLFDIRSESVVTSRIMDLSDLPDLQGSDGNEQLQQFMATTHAADHLYTGAQLSLDVQRDVTLTARNLRIEVLDRGPALEGTVLYYAGGGLIEYSADIDFDSDPPVVSYSCNGEPCDELVIHLTESEGAAVEVMGHASNSYVEWRATIDLYVDGVLESVDLGTRRLSGSPMGDQPWYTIGADGWQVTTRS